ncbi:hypothetical protein PV325_011319 [Microctonus aethiopoides]|nr:hypothetical protein PV325_011319 [Microctonus aethiopoides]
MSICSVVISPSSQLSPKTNAERQREYRLRKNDNVDKPVKMSKAEYNCQYRLKKKMGAKLKSDFAKIVLRQEVGSSEYPDADFLHEALLAYTKGDAQLDEENPYTKFHKLESHIILEL